MKALSEETKNTAEGIAELGAKMSRLMTKDIDNPRLWKLDRSVYDWLTDDDVKTMDRYPFDYGDILYQFACFLPENLIAGALGVKDNELDRYCQILWHKPWDYMRMILKAAARNDVVTNIFGRWAKEGSSTALSIMSNSVMKMNEEAENKAITIKIVNDIGDDE